MFISTLRNQAKNCTLYNLYVCVCVQTFLLPQQSIVCDMYPKLISEEKSNNSIVVILHMRHMGP